MDSAKIENIANQFCYLHVDHLLRTGTLRGPSHLWLNATGSLSQYVTLL